MRQIWQIIKVYISGLLEWLFWVVLFAFLPLGVHLFVASIIRQDFEIYKVSTEIFFISVSVGASALRTIIYPRIQGKIKKISTKMRFVSYFLILLLIFDSGFYFVLVLFDLLPPDGEFQKLFDMNTLLSCSKWFMVACVVLGLGTEIWSIGYELVQESS